MKTSVVPDPATKMTPSWDLVPKSFTILKANVEAVLFVLFLPALVSILGSILSGSRLLHDPVTVSPGRAHLGLALSLVSFVAIIVNSGPSTLLEIKGANNLPTNVAQLYRDGLKYSLRIFAFYIAFILGVLIGLVLLIVPGLVILRRYILTPYYLVDKNLSIREAMQLSSEESKPIKGYVWGVVGIYIVFSIAAAVLEVIPLIGLVLGQLVTYVILFVFALRYMEVQAAALATPKRS